MTPSGTLIDATPLSLGTGVSPEVAFDGTNFVTVWRLESFAWWTRIKAARVSPGGVVLDNPELTVVDGSGVRRYLRAAGGAGQTLACWEDEVDSSLGDIFCSRIAQDGTVQEPEGFELTAGFGSNTDRAPSVAYDGTNWLVAWQRGSNANASIVGTRVDATGSKVDTTFSPAVISLAAGIQQRPHVVFDGTQYVVAWQDDRDGNEDVRAARVLPDLTMLDGTSDGILVATTPDNQVEPAVAAGGGAALIAWTDDRHDLGGVNSADIYGARIDASGTLLDGPASSGGVPLSFVANEQRSASSSWSGTTWLVVWEDERDPSGSDLWGARFDAAGTLLDTNAIAIATGPGTQASPSVAWNGSGWLVAFTDSPGTAFSQTRATRVTPGGSVLDGSLGVFVSPTGSDQFGTGLAWGGSAWTVVYRDRRNATGAELRATRLDASLNSLGDFVVRTAQVGSVDRIGIASDGSRFLATWTEQPNTMLLGARVDFDGTVLDTTPLSIGTEVRRAFPGTPVRTPDVASAGSGWTVVWENLGDIFEARVAADGTVTPERRLSPIAGAQTFPGVGHDGLRFQVVWQDHANTGAGGGGVDLRGVFISDSGSLLNTSPLVVSSLPGDDRAPEVEGSSAGQSLVAYHRFDPNPPFRNERVRARLVTSGAALGASCTVDSDCVTQHCAGGTCQLAPPDAGNDGADGSGGSAGAAGAGGAAGTGGATDGGGGSADAAAGAGGAGAGGTAGGTSGTGGASATGGGAGIGGSATAGTGGGVLDAGGADAPSSSGGSSSGDDGGCGCRVTGSHANGFGSFALLVALVFARRRRPARAAPPGLDE